MANLFFFKTFVDAAKTGSIRASANRNYVTQPAVTKHIHVLEEKLECQLFERRNKKIILTPCGKTFLGYAQSILAQYEEAKIRLREVRKIYTGTLRIGTIYSIGLYHLQPTIENYLKKFPKIDFHLEYHPFDKIVAMVSERLIDFGFVAYPKRKQGVISQVFAEEKLVLAQSSHHRVIKAKTASLKSLDGVKFVAFPSNAPTREAIDNFLSSKKIRPKIVNEYDNIETLKSALQLGLGCSIVPKNALAEEIKKSSLEIIPVKDLTLTRPLGILYPKSKILTTSARGFYKAVTGKPLA